MTISASFSGNFAPIPPFSGGMRPIRAHLPCRAHQPSPHHPQITQCKQRHDLCRVLDQSAVPHLAVPKLAFDHPELMLDLGTNAGLQFFNALNGFSNAFIVVCQGSCHVAHAAIFSDSFV